MTRRPVDWLDVAIALGNGIAIGGGFVSVVFLNGGLFGFAMGWGCARAAYALGLRGWAAAMAIPVSLAIVLICQGIAR